MRRPGAAANRESAPACLRDAPAPPAARPPIRGQDFTALRNACPGAPADAFRAQVIRATLGAEGHIWPVRNPRGRTTAPRNPYLGAPRGTGTNAWGPSATRATPPASVGPRNGSPAGLITTASAHRSTGTSISATTPSPPHSRSRTRRPPVASDRKDSSNTPWGQRRAENRAELQEAPVQHPPADGGLGPFRPQPQGDHRPVREAAGPLLLPQPAGAAGQVVSNRVRPASRLRPALRNLGVRRDRTRLGGHGLSSVVASPPEPLTGSGRALADTRWAARPTATTS